MAQPDPVPASATAGEDGWSVARPAGLPARYRIDRPVARAGAGARWLATDTATGARVFVKAGSATEQLRREAAALAAIDHPGVVRLLERRSQDDRAVLVVEQVDGGDLEAFIAGRGGRLDAGPLRALLLGLVDALGAIHRAGFLHRDLKPANVVVRGDGRPVIVDLGAALPLAEALRPPPLSQLSEGYAAPEQYASDRPEGPWTDLYGLGAIGYRALLGEAPPPAPERLRQDPVAAALGESNDDAAGLRRAIAWALALAEEARPQTAAEWHAALQGDGHRPGRLAGAGQPLDDYPPTIEVERQPHRRLARRAPPPAGAASGAAPRRRRGVRGALLLTLLLLALTGGLGAWAWQWQGRALYERHVKSAWLVDPAGGGDALTIADALARAGPGATIRIEPGRYRESLALRGPVHLEAATADQPPVIAPDEGPCLRATGDGGSLKGLALEAPERRGPEPGVCLVLGGDLVVEGNQIVGGAGPAVLVRAGAAPQVRSNRIGKGAGPGIVVRGGARGAIEDNQIEARGGPGLIVRQGAQPTIAGNTIEASGPVVFAEGAGGSFAGNQVTSSRASALEVTSGAAPLIRANTIEQAGEAGIFVYDRGQGRLEGNRITGAHLSGVVVAGGSDVTLIDNTIRASGEHGVLVIEGGRARIEANTIEASKRHGIAVAPGGEVELVDNTLRGNAEPQLLDARGK